MDANRFDHIAKVWHAGRTRRATLQALAAAGAAALGLAPRPGAAARKKGSNAKCRRDKDCKSRECIKCGLFCRKLNGGLTGKCRCSCEEDANCPTDSFCRNGACTKGFCEASSTCASGVSCGLFCLCMPTDLGTTCVDDAIISGFDCEGFQTCAASADCPAGWACVELDAPCGGCDLEATKFCAKVCGVE